MEAVEFLAFRNQDLKANQGVRMETVEVALIELLGFCF